MDGDAAQAWFVAGTIVFIAAGGLHAVYALIDTVRPTYFAPTERSVRSGMEGTSIRLIPRGSRPARSMRFCFYGPVLITGTATACFVVATVLSA